jgi:hypothetical protein
VIHAARRHSDGSFRQQFSALGQQNRWSPATSMLHTGNQSPVHPWVMGMAPFSPCN